MKVEILVVADVFWAIPEDKVGKVKEGSDFEKKLCASVEEAIMDALVFMKQEYEFEHKMEDLISILPDYAKARIVDYD